MSCQCVVEDEPKLTIWRDACRQYYFHQDEQAKVLLDAYEDAKTRTSDEVTIEIGDESHPSLREIGLARCPVEGHAAQFDANLIVLETVKNEVRGEFHAHMSALRYSDFRQRLQVVQSCFYQIDPASQQLVVRPQEGYVRSQADFDVKRGQLLRFLGEYARNIGAHPFLHGLHRMLSSNMHQTTIVAWEVSNATFVESAGAEFTSAALTLLVETLQCGHTETPDGNSSIWFLDPFLSNHHIRRMLWIFPNMKQIEGRATGTEVATTIERTNAKGQHDEPPTWLKMCTVL
ncbi:hypothetical protein LEN26_012623 [Aphanomyces euteiches]|nr:hypothetical protein LEN26_012623 [Aphanomyces euteiches]